MAAAGCIVGDEGWPNTEQLVGGGVYSDLADVLKVYNVISYAHPTTYRYHDTSRIRSCYYPRKPRQGCRQPCISIRSPVLHQLIRGLFHTAVEVHVSGTCRFSIVQERVVSRHKIERLL
jgi:hypothetical protein